MSTVKEFTELSNLVLWRLEQRLKENSNEYEEEKEKFFFWIMSRILWKVEGSYPAQKCNKIELEAAPSGFGTVCVKHGNVDEYYSYYLKRDEFVKLMKEISDILNTFPNFNSLFLHNKTSNKAELFITLISTL